MSQGNAGVQSVPVMLTVANYMKENDIQKHCYDVADFYKDRADWMMHCVNKYLPHYVRPNVPEGGLFLWLNVPEVLDLNAIWHELMEKNVGVVPSFGFSADPENCPGSAFRMCYSTPPREVIEEACKVIGAVLREHLPE